MLYDTARRIKTAITNRNNDDARNMIKKATGATNEEVMRLAIVIDSYNMPVVAIGARLQGLKSLVMGRNSTKTLADRIENDPLKMAWQRNQIEFAEDVDDRYIEILKQLHEKVAEAYPDLDQIDDREEHFAGLIDAAVGRIKQLEDESVDAVKLLESVLIKHRKKMATTTAETVAAEKDSEEWSEQWMATDDARKEAVEIARVRLKRACVLGVEKDAVIAEKDKWKERALKAEEQSRKKDTVIDTIQSIKHDLTIKLEAAKQQSYKWKALARNRGEKIQYLREATNETVQAATEEQETPQGHEGSEE